MEYQGRIGGSLKTAFAFALAAAVLVLAYWLRNIILLSFLAIILGILLDAIAVGGMRYLKLPRTAAVIVAAIVFVTALGAALAMLLVPLAKQGTEFIHKLPAQIARMDHWVARYRHDFPWIDRIWPAPKAASERTEKKADAPELAKKALITVSTAIDWGATALAVFFLALFLALNPERWLRGVARLWPGPDVEWRITLFRRLGEGLRSYLFTLLLYILLMGAGWSVGLYLIGVDYSLLFGAIGGLAEIVPYFGPLVGLIPPLLYSLSAGTSKVLYLLLLYVVLHILEGYVLVPLLMHKREHLPPPLVVLSIVICGELFGVLGVVLAVPLATVGYLLAKETIYSTPKSPA